MAPPSIVAFAFALAGCSLALGGLETGADGEGGKGARDAASDAVVSPHLEAGPSDAGGGAACLSSIPAGWSLVLFESSRAPCPSGLAAHDLVDDPQASAGACTCSCEVTSAPSCATGTLQGGYGTMGCNTKVWPLSISGSGCTQLQPGGPVPANIAIDALPSTGGACSSNAVGDTTKVATNPVRTCDIGGAGADAQMVCQGAAPAGFSSCIATAGDVPCPTGSDFTTRAVLGSSETLVCSECSSCTVAADCSSPLVTFYSDYLCTQAVATFPANGACMQPGWTGNIAGVEYHVTSQATCAASGSAATFQPADAQTVCCR
jgi:hypothetical protein